MDQLMYNCTQTQLTVTRLKRIKVQIMKLQAENGWFGGDF